MGTVGAVAAAMAAAQAWAGRKWLAFCAQTEGVQGKAGHQDSNAPHSSAACSQHGPRGLVRPPYLLFLPKRQLLWDKVGVAGP